MLQCIAADAVLARRAEIIPSVPGCGPLTAACLCAELPELDTISHRQAAALLGGAPFDRDSGPSQRRRWTRGACSTWPPCPPSVGWDLPVGPATSASAPLANNTSAQRSPLCANSPACSPHCCATTAAGKRNRLAVPWRPLHEPHLHQRRSNLDRSCEMQENHLFSAYSARTCAGPPTRRLGEEYKLDQKSKDDRAPGKDRKLHDG